MGRKRRRKLDVSSLPRSLKDRSRETSLLKEFLNAGMHCSRQPEERRQNVFSIECVLYQTLLLDRMRSLSNSISMCSRVL